MPCTNGIVSVSTADQTWPSKWRLRVLSGKAPCGQTVVAGRNVIAQTSSAELPQMAPCTTISSPHSAQVTVIYGRSGRTTGANQAVHLSPCQCKNPRIDPRAQTSFDELPHSL